MVTVSRILFGILFIGIGFLITWKAYPIKNTVGVSAWAERNIGAGGTITLIRAVGIFIILLSFMYMTGLLQKLLLATVGGLFGAGH